MYRYRNDSVTLEPVKTIPVLVACRDKGKADGVVVHVQSVDEAQRLGGVVRVIDQDALELFESDGRAFQREYGSVADADSYRLLGLLQLAQALATGDGIAWRSACERLGQELGYKMFPDLRVLERQPGFELVRLLARGLKDVQLVLWWKEQGKDLVALPGLRCPDALSALYTLALIRIAGGKGVGACLNCGGAIVQSRGLRRRYCSNKCKMRWHRSHPAKPRGGAKKSRKRRSKR